MIEIDERQVTPSFKMDKIFPKNVYLLREPFDSVTKTFVLQFWIKTKSMLFFFMTKGCLVLKK